MGKLENRNYMVARSRPHVVNRSLELRIKGHLYEISSIDDEAIESKQGFHMAEDGYRKTLESVADCAGTELVDEIADRIKDQIRTDNERPRNQSVRRDARMLLAENDIVADEYLNKA